MISVRDKFPIFETLAFLDSCSHGALSREVEAAYAAYLEDRRTFGTHWGHWMGIYEDVRRAIARLIHAEPHEIAITGSVSAALNAVASAMDFSGSRPGVVVSDIEFPTASQIWHAQAPRGALVQHASVEGARDQQQAFAALIDRQTAMVSVTHVSYRTGARIDVPALAALARENGAYFLLDSFQALGSFPVDVKELDVDFLVGGCTKYLLGSSGLSFLYVREGLIPDLHPTTSGWFAQKNIHAMDIYHHDPAATARKFEMGTPPVPNLYAALAGLNIILEAEPEKIWEHVSGLGARIIHIADDLGIPVGTPRAPAERGAMIALQARDEVAAVEACRSGGVVVSERAGHVRVSPHLYNNEEDLDRLAACLKLNRSLFA